MYLSSKDSLSLPLSLSMFQERREKNVDCVARACRENEERIEERDLNFASI